MSPASEQNTELLVFKQFGPALFMLDHPVYSLHVQYRRQYLKSVLKEITALILMSSYLQQTIVSCKKLGMDDMLNNATAVIK